MSQYYLLIVYMFSDGPFPLAGSLSVVASCFSIFISMVGGYFKFNMSKLTAKAEESPSGSSPPFNIYFFSKMLYVICSLVLNLYLFFIFIIRYDIDKIELPEMKDPYEEGRREFGTQKAVFISMAAHCFVLLANVFHLLQNLYWLKLKSSSWMDVTAKSGRGEEQDDSF